MRWLASYIMTTANPYVCSDVSSSNDISVPYCDSEDDTEYHNGFGSDAWIDDMHLEGRFQDQLRVEHDTTHPEKKHLEEHFATWKKTNHVHVKKMRKEFIEKHRETQKSGHTAAGKKAHKDNKGKKSNQKMSKFSSDFRKLCESWKNLSYSHYHNAWVESRNIVKMEEGEAKNEMIEKYKINHKSQIIRSYLKMQENTDVFSEIDKTERMQNMMKFFETDMKKSDLASIQKKEKSIEDHNEKENNITGGN